MIVAEPSAVVVAGTPIAPSSLDASKVPEAFRRLQVTLASRLSCTRLQLRNAGAPLASSSEAAAHIGERVGVRGFIERVWERAAHVKEASMRQAPEITHEARVLRQSAMAAEKLLWPFLRARRLDGVKIRRGRPVGRQIVSFYVAGARLAIQIEPGAHIAFALHDAARRHDVSLLPLAAEDIPADPAAAIERIRQRLTYV